MTKRVTSSQPTVSDTIPQLSALPPIFQLHHTLHYCDLLDFEDLGLLSPCIIFIDVIDLYISHHSTITTYLTVRCLINLYSCHSLLPQFSSPISSPISSLSPQFSLCLCMDTPHIVCCKAGDDGHWERSGLAWLGWNLMTTSAIPSLEHQQSPFTSLFLLKLLNASSLVPSS